MSDVAYRERRSSESTSASQRDPRFIDRPLGTWLPHKHAREHPTIRAVAAAPIRAGSYGRMFD